MANPKTTKLIIKRKKFIEVEIPMLRTKIELIGESPEELKGRTIKLDLTRQLKGKSVEAIVKVVIEQGKPVAHPVKIKLMPYFIRRMIRKRISYVEDSFETPSQENMITIKPFIITRKRVSRVIRKTLRNKAKNFIGDYVAERKNNDIFNDILTNRFQKQLSLYLKKTYPLSLCEIRIIQTGRPLSLEEVPKIKEKIKEEKVEIGEGLDQLAEIEQERVKKAEQEIKITQEKASSKENPEETDVQSSDSTKSESSDSKESEPASKKKPRKKKEEKAKEE